VNLTRDARQLFIARFTRLFAYGALSVVLVLYLTSIGLNETQIGILLTLTLAGDAAVSLFITTRADRIGRRRMLTIGAILMAAAGVAFGVTRNFLWLAIAGTIGVISPSGNEVGPFLSIEQAALSQVVPASARTEVFGWHTLTAAFGTAVGALFGGTLVHLLQATPLGAVGGYRAVVMFYAACGISLAFLFRGVSPAVEVTNDGAIAPQPFGKAFWGLTHSRPAVVKLAGLFALDSFAGGYVVQSFAAYWFYLRFGVDPQALGMIFFGANVFAGISALVAARLASRFGLVNTMVFTHLPSNVLLILVPLMPNLPLAIAVLLLRFSISQMDVPTRQAYLMSVVSTGERSAAGGVTGIARTVGAAVAPVFAGFLFAHRPLMNMPFFIAGGLKIAYDLLLYRGFVSVKPSEDM
jgi:MFS family permease